MFIDYGGGEGREETLYKDSRMGEVKDSVSCRRRAHNVDISMMFQ